MFIGNSIITNFRNVLVELLFLNLGRVHTGDKIDRADDFVASVYAALHTFS